MTMASPLYLSHVFQESKDAVIFGQLMTYACVLVVLMHTTHFNGVNLKTRDS